jgi:hypothetical protein
MKLLIKEHRNAGRIIPEAIQAEVKAAVENAKSVAKATPTRDSILGTLRKRHGWSDTVMLCSDAKISITGKKGDVGLCIQTGNMSRFYADLLKLEYLFKKDLIHGAIYILPDKALSKVWGENIAHFERFTNEVGIFSQIIHTPLLILGIPKV